MHTYKWHTTTDANTQWHCEERTHMHLLHPVWHRVPPNSSIIYRPRHTRLFITNVFFLCTACLCEGRRQACSLCVAFAKPIKNLNVDWPVYHKGALSLVSFAFGVTDQQDFWLSGSISKTVEYVHVYMLDLESYSTHGVSLTADVFKSNNADIHTTN